MADPTQIHQIVMNLITNAYHAVEKTGGKITVALEKPERKPTD
jgi:two-component system cell cycle sensor histidine kinase/response regulator CckA